MMDGAQHACRPKGRSASISAAPAGNGPSANHNNNANIMGAAAATTATKAALACGCTPPPSRRRNRPAARSQSARFTTATNNNVASTGGTGAASRASVRRPRVPPAQPPPPSSVSNAVLPASPLSNSNSEPKLVLSGDGGTTAIDHHHHHHHQQQQQQQQQSLKMMVQQQQNILVISPATPEPSPLITRRRATTRRATAGPLHYRKSNAGLLDVPAARGTSSQSDHEDDDSYRLRSFSFTSKGIVNRGDSFRRRRSRSNSLCPTTTAVTATTSRASSPALIENRDSTVPVTNYMVALLGPQGVGKTALISQFMTSECINAYDRQKDMLGNQTVSIMLNGEESELTFLNIQSTTDMDVVRLPDAFVILYSVVDKSSFLKAELELTKLQDMDLLYTRPAILVANKIDLARSRAVSPQDGKCLACTFRAKFIEISVGINHNVDELLVGILTQIRLKGAGSEVTIADMASYNGSSHDNPHHPHRSNHHHQWYKSRGVVKASMKARQMFGWLFGKEDSKFKNCENLHVL